MATKIDRITQGNCNVCGELTKVISVDSDIEFEWDGQLTNELYLCEDCITLMKAKFAEGH